MVRRVIEEDVAAPSTTVVEDDGSWVGRTIVTLVILALVVAGAVWLVNSMSGDNDVDAPGTVQNDDTGTDTGNDGGTDTGTDTDPTTDTTVPSAVPS